jgi:hypothetical protein
MKRPIIATTTSDLARLILRTGSSTTTRNSSTIVA